MNQQKLIESLNHLLPQFSQGISEFELIKVLQSEPYCIFDKDALRDELRMFQCHFILFNALYRLRDQWFDEQIGYIDIVVTRIQISSWTAQHSTMAKLDPLREYYLDWRNFDNTAKQDVLEMIEEFWNAMGSVEACSEQDLIAAEAILGVERTMEISDLKRTYKHHLHLHHPDKGGDLEKAQQIDWAFRVLKRNII